MQEEASDTTPEGPAGADGAASGAKVVTPKKLLVTQTFKPKQAFNFINLQRTLQKSKDGSVDSTRQAAVVPIIK